MLGLIGMLSPELMGFLSNLEMAWLLNFNSSFSAVLPDTGHSGVHVDYELVLHGQEVLEQRQQNGLGQPIETVTLHRVREPAMFLLNFSSMTGEALWC